MDTNILTRPTTHVNLADETVATVSDGHGLQIRHGGQLLTAMELAEAIKVAKMVLTYAEHYGLTTEDAADDVGQMDEDAYYDSRAAMLEDWRAVVDSALERNG